MGSKTNYSAMRVGFLLLASPFAVVASPGKQAPDTDTIALWHFEDDIRASVQFAADGAAHTLVPYGTGQNVRNGIGYNQLGRAVSGFTVSRGIETTTAGDSKMQTLEAWVSWRSDAELPASWPNPQVVMSNLVSSTFSTYLAFQSGQLVLQVRSGDGAGDVRSLALPVSPEPYKWYHVAYTLAAGQFGGGSIEDVRARLYWSSEDTLTATPAPAAQAEWIDFPYRANGFRLRIGKRNGTGNDEFKGAIDEVHYSRSVRASFPMLMAGAPERYLPSRTFSAAALIVGPNTPDYEAEGLHKIGVVAPQGQFWAPGADVIAEFPSRQHSVALADYQLSVQGSDRLYYLNIENQPYSFVHTPAQLDATIQKLSAVADWIHQAHPHMRLGYYEILPERQYFNRTGANRASWQARNARFKSLADHVDVVYPSLYTFYGIGNLDRDGWVEYARDMLNESRQYNKPVYAFLMPEYHHSNTAGCAGRPIDGDFWRLQLETAYEYADGVVIWAGGSRDFNERIDTTPDPCAPSPNACHWWCQTVNFLGEKGLRD